MARSPNVRFRTLPAAPPPSISVLVWGGPFAPPPVAPNGLGWDVLRWLAALGCLSGLASWLCWLAGVASCVGWLGWLAVHAGLGWAGLG